MDINGTTLLLSHPREPGSGVSVDIREVFESERRQAEIAFVTPVKAPELLRALSYCWRETHKKMLEVNKWLLQAQNHAAARRATIVLDVAPGVLQQKGLASNEENRLAVIELDAEYQKRRDVVEEIEAAVEFLKGKLKTIERDHSAIRAIVHDGSYSGSVRYSPNSGLSGGVTQEQPAAAPPQSPPKATRPPGFGKAAY